VIKWPVRFFTFFTFFSKSKKHDFLRIFELLHTFSRTLGHGIYRTQIGSLGKLVNAVHRVLYKHPVGFRPQLFQMMTDSIIDLFPENYVSVVEFPISTLPRCYTSL